MTGYSPKEIRKQETLTVGASETDTVVSAPAGLSVPASLRMRVDMLVSDVTSTTGITAKLQHSTFDGEWADLAGANASVAITADGEFSITQLIERSADQPNMPIKKQIRVVCTTGAGDTVTFTSIKLSPAF